MVLAIVEETPPIVIVKLIVPESKITADVDVVKVTMPAVDCARVNPAGLDGRVTLNSPIVGVPVVAVSSEIPLYTETTQLYVVALRGFKSDVVPID